MVSVGLFVLIFGLVFVFVLEERAGFRVGIILVLVKVFTCL